MDSPLRVLVVDDDEDFRFLLRIQLGLEEDLEIVGAAADGAEAIEQVRELQPDAVAMDLLMPNVDGFSAIEILQRDHPAVAVVAYTAVAGQYARDRMQELGVELVLKSGDQKPLAAALRRSAGRTSPSGP